MYDCQFSHKLFYLANLVLNVCQCSPSDHFWSEIINVTVMSHRIVGVHANDFGPKLTGMITLAIIKGSRSKLAKLKILGLNWPLDNKSKTFWLIFSNLHRWNLVKLCTLFTYHKLIWRCSHVLTILGIWRKSSNKTS